jgi:hypothetical protein
MSPRCEREGNLGERPAPPKCRDTSAGGLTESPSGSDAGAARGIRRALVVQAP